MRDIAYYKIGQTVKIKGCLWKIKFVNKELQKYVITRRDKLFGRQYIDTITHEDFDRHFKKLYFNKI